MTKKVDFTSRCRASAQGMVGICGSGTSPIIIPTRSKGEPIMGNNPLAIEAPAVNDGESFMLDMAMSTVAFGKVEIQKMKGQDLPSNRWSVDPQGCPTTDPVAGSQPGAALQPLGGSEIDASHKGYGLSVASINLGAPQGLKCSTRL